MRKVPDRLWIIALMYLIGRKNKSQSVSERTKKAQVTWFIHEDIKIHKQIVDNLASGGSDLAQH